MLCCLFSEKVVTMENPISIQSSSEHPKWPDSSQPPLISFENEVSIVKSDDKEFSLVTSNTVILKFMFVFDVNIHTLT